MEDMKWEYKVIQLHPELSMAGGDAAAEALNAHGSQGWEAIAFYLTGEGDFRRRDVVFKRPVKGGQPSN